MDATPWTLQELTARIDAALRRAGIHQDNGQVAEAPNGRAIRWYQSSGLLRRPEQRGRTAFYGPMHLAEVVAIKRLQSEGHSLSDVQARLLGLADDAICALAGVDVSADGDSDSDSNSAVASAGDFWHGGADADVSDVVDSSVVVDADHGVAAARVTYDAGDVSLTLPAHVDAAVARAVLARVLGELSPHLVVDAAAKTTSPRSQTPATSTEEDR